jgi:hypothetical protein
MTAAMTAMPQQQEPQKLAVTASSKASPLRWLTKGNPTNYNMLLFRTMNRQVTAQLSSSLLCSSCQHWAWRTYQAGLASLNELSCILLPGAPNTNVVFILCTQLDVPICNSTPV